MLIKLENIKKTYSTKSGVTFRAITDISLSFEDTGLVFIVGKSGSGKSTLLNIIGGLDKADSGNFIVSGNNLTKSKDVDSYRNTMLGFVFQDFNLLNNMNVFENVKLSLDLQSINDKNKIQNAISQVGLEGKENESTLNLSGGQKQRVAIARALVKNPRIILADEPTGALDSKTGNQIMKIFSNLSKEKLIIVVTHDMEKALEYGDRIVEIRDGKVFRDVKKSDSIIKDSSISFVSNELIKVNDKTQISETHIDKINKTIEEIGQKVYVFTETTTQKVQAMYPQLADVITEENSKGYVPYVEKDTEIASLSFQKGKLPIKRSLKMGIKNTQHKKGKLFLIILMSIIAFVMFTVSISLQSFDFSSCLSQTLIKENYDVLTLMNAHQSDSQKSHFNDSQIEKLQENTDCLIYKQTALQLNFNYKVFNKFTSFDGIVEVDDMSKLGYSMLCGLSKPINYNSIIISDYAIEKLIENKTISASNLDEAIGKNIILNNSTFTIVGIFENKYKKSNSKEYELEKENYLCNIYVKRNFIKEYIKSISIFNDGFSVMLSYINDKEVGKHNTKQNIKLSLYDETLKENENYHFSTTGIDNGSTQISDNNEIIISKTLLENGFGIFIDDISKPTINELNNDKSTELTLYYNDLPVFSMQNIKVNSVITGDSLGTNGFVTSEKISNDIFSKVMYTKQLLVVPQSDDATRQLVGYMYKNDMLLNASFVEDYENVFSISSSFNSVILAISLLFMVLVIVLLYSFISNSIILTKKHIGILRALGTKKSDTFMIYAIEGFFVTLISLIVSIVILLILPLIVNSIFASIYGVYLQIISITFKSYLLLIGLSLIVTIISILIPINKYNQISPIDAINAKE